MKLHPSILALFIALLPLTNVHAADNEKEFLQSLSVPLSSTETARLDYLIKNKAAANEAAETATREWRLAEKAAESAAPSVRVDLLEKSEAARLVSIYAERKQYQASQELSNFKQTMQRRPRLPAAVVRAMKPGAVSLVYGNLKIGPNAWPASIHISVVPKPLPGDTSTTKAPGVDTPSIEERLLAPSTFGYVLNAARSPFYVDIFSASSDQPNAPYQLVNSTHYVDQGFVPRIELKYLKPKFKQGPMVMINASAYRSTDVRLLTFPDGLRGKLVAEHIRYSFNFTAPDKRGIIGIEEKRYANMYGGGSVSDDDSIIRHVWNGQGFVAQREVFLIKPYMVIGALSRNRAQLEKLHARLANPSAEVLPTSKYPLLPSNHYVLVLARLKTRQQADQWLKGNRDYLLLNKSAASGFKFEVRRAS